MQEEIHDLYGAVDQEAFACRKIPGADGYYVTSHGDVFSSKTAHGGINGTLKKLVPVKPRQGYLTVHLSSEGRAKIKYIHRLVLESFVGLCPKGHEGSHLNGNRTDNRLANLVWESVKDNCDRRWGHGTVPLGEDTNSVKLKSSDIPVIRQRIASGETHRSIASSYNVSKGAIGSIKRGETWSHIK